MSRKSHFSTLLLCLALIVGESNIASAQGGTLLQRDWMINLVEALGLSFGLPDSPSDGDYLRVLGGNRTLRVEAEETHHQEDLVAAESFVTFGPYSGKGWVSGINVPTRARLNFLLPLGGTYSLSANLRRPGHTLRIGERILSADGGENFTVVNLGQVELHAGQNEIEVTLPPGGGIDYLDLWAPPLSAVEPVGGWKLESPLTVDVMAQTVARLLALEPLLPAAGESVKVEAENALATGEADVARTTHLGEPSGGRWVRAGARPTQVDLIFSPPSAGIYAVTLRGAGGRILAEVNDGAAIDTNTPSFLQDVPLGTHPLAGGKNRLRLQLPPRAGVDAILLHPRRNTAGDYRRLVGLPSTGDTPTAEQVDTLLSLLSVLGRTR